LCAVSENWAAVAADVIAAMAEVGMAATLTRPDTGPATPWDTAPVVAGAALAVTVMRDTWTRRHVDGTLIMADDAFFLMDATVAPTPDDRLTVGGDVFRVIRVKPTSPGGVAVLYEVQARR
jgi:hypothetical protein